MGERPVLRTETKWSVSKPRWAHNNQKKTRILDWIRVFIWVPLCLGEKFMQTETKWSVSKPRWAHNNQKKTRILDWIRVFI
jgi:hypothetical protein